MHLSAPMLLRSSRCHGATTLDAMPRYVWRRNVKPNWRSSSDSTARCSKMSPHVCACSRRRDCQRRAPQLKHSGDERAHLDADGVKQPLVHTPNAGNFADGEVVRERFDCGGLEVELELSVGFILCFRCERDHLRGKYGRRTLSEQIWETVSVGLEDYV